MASAGSAAGTLALLEESSPALLVRIREVLSAGLGRGVTRVPCRLLL